MATSSIGRVVRLDNEMACRIIAADKRPATVATTSPKGLPLVRDVSIAAARRRAKP